MQCITYFLRAFPIHKPASYLRISSLIGSRESLFLSFTAVLLSCINYAALQIVKHLFCNALPFCAVQRAVHPAHVYVDLETHSSVRAIGNERAGDV